MGVCIRRADPAPMTHLTRMPARAPPPRHLILDTLHAPAQGPRVAAIVAPRI